MKRNENRERGQALVLMIVVMSIVFLGMMGFALDMSRMYAQKQMAQTAADAAAQAAAMSIMSGTNTGSNSFGSSSFTCSGTTLTPCAYASLNGFSSANGDTVKVDFPGSVSGVNISNSFTANAVRVTIIRPTPTSLMKLLKVTSLNVAAQATSAISANLGAPIISLSSGILVQPVSTSAGTTIQICGGGTTGMEIRASPYSWYQLWNPGATSMLGNGTINLSHAGPADNGTCTKGTGADLAYAGSSGNSGFGNVSLGTTGNIVNWSSVADPYSSINSPSTTGLTNNPAVCTVKTTAGTPNACQNSIGYSTLGCAANSTCKLYFPGVYSSGISISGGITAVFAPGTYYMSSSGFSVANTCNALDAGGFAADSVTGPGKLIYLSGSATLSLTSSGTVRLTGSSSTSIYKGILFFADRFNLFPVGHTIGSNGTIDLVGALYFDSLFNTAHLLNFPVTSGHPVKVGQLVVDGIYTTGSGTVTLILPYGGSTGGTGTSAGTVGLAN